MKAIALSSVIAGTVAAGLTVSPSERVTEGADVAVVDVLRRDI
jgi:hypothetical protein